MLCANLLEQQQHHANLPLLRACPVLHHCTPAEQGVCAIPCARHCPMSCISPQHQHKNTTTGTSTSTTITPAQYPFNHQHNTRKITSTTVHTHRCRGGSFCDLSLYTCGFLQSRKPTSSLAFCSPSLSTRVGATYCFENKKGFCTYRVSPGHWAQPQAGQCGHAIVWDTATRQHVPA